MKDRLIRVYAAFIELADAFVDLFVEPLKVWLPWECFGWRPDNATGWKWVKKPLGYWVGHIIGVPAFLWSLWALGTLSGMLFTVIQGSLGVDVRF